MYEFILLLNLKIENLPYINDKGNFKINEDRCNSLENLANNVKVDLRSIMLNINLRSQYFEK